MAKKKPMSPERAEWEATRAERERYLYGRANDMWRETKAREESKREATEGTGRHLRILRRLRRFR